MRGEEASRAIELVEMSCDLFFNHAVWWINDCRFCVLSVELSRYEDGLTDTQQISTHKGIHTD